MKLDMFKQRLLIVAFIVLGVVALPVTVYLVQQQQSIRQSASGTKSLTLTPGSQNVKVGDTVKYDIILHPNGVAVRYVNLVINYDSTKLSAKASGFTKNPSFDFNPKTKTFTDGRIVLEFQTSDLAKYVSKEIIVGSISFRALDKTYDVISHIEFGNLKTVVKGASNNVLSYQFNNASVTITDGTAICPVDNAICSWSPVDGAVSYHYKITKGDQAGTIVKEGDTTDTTIPFDSEAGGTYICTVSAANGCGNGTEGKDTATCASPTPTVSISPTESVTPTVTPTGTITITETVTPTESLTPTESVTPTVTLTPTVTSTNTPTPTVKPTATATPTHVPTSTPTTFIATGTVTPTTFVPTNTPNTFIPGQIITATPTSVPAPLPPTGSNTFTLGAILGTMLVVLGGLLLLVF